MLYVLDLWNTGTSFLSTPSLEYVRDVLEWGLSVMSVTVNRVISKKVFHIGFCIFLTGSSTCERWPKGSAGLLLCGCSCETIFSVCVDY